MAETINIVTYISKLNDTNMYLVQDKETDHAILIDPSEAEPVREWLRKEQLWLDYIILTHEHYDHIAALNQLIREYPAPVVASGACSEGIQSAKRNMSRIFNEVLAFQKEKYPDKEIFSGSVKPYEAQSAQVTFEEEFQLNWNSHQVQIWEAPGHSKGSVLISLDGKYLFSGDTLSCDYELITGFPGGSKKEYEQITRPLLQSFDKEMKVYPGHGNSFVMKEAEDRI